MRARDFQKPGEHLLVIYTRGPHFHQGPDQTATSGMWVLSADRAIDRVLIYQRDENTGVATLHLGTFAGREARDPEGKSTINLTHVQYVGATTESWATFAEAGQNPVRYLD